jgi:hypothetical protein
MAPVRNVQCTALVEVKLTAIQVRKSLRKLHCYRQAPTAQQEILLLLFSLALQPTAGYGLLVSRGFLITHNDAPQSVGLLWTSYQLVAETST